jgi:hypothetical protein
MKPLEENTNLFATVATIFCVAIGIKEINSYVDVIMDFLLEVWNNCIKEATGVNPHLVQALTVLPAEFGAVVLAKAMEEWEQKGEFLARSALDGAEKSDESGS